MITPLIMPASYRNFPRRNTSIRRGPERRKTAYDVLGLGVGFRLLMQQLYGRHFPAALGDLDAIPDQDQPAIDAQRTWKQPQHRLRPQGRQPIKLEGAAMEVFQ